MYIVNIKIPDALKGKIQIKFPNPNKIKETEEKTLKVEKQSISFLKLIIN